MSARALQSADSAARREAARAFAHFAPRSPAAVHALLGALASEENADVHGTIAEALGTLGPSAAPAVPRLAALLRDGREGVREQAANALGQIGPAARPAVPALERALAEACARRLERRRAVGGASGATARRRAA